MVCHNDSVDPNVVENIKFYFNFTVHKSKLCSSFISQ